MSRTYAVFFAVRVNVFVEDDTAVTHMEKINWAGRKQHVPELEAVERLARTAFSKERPCELSGCEHYAPNAVRLEIDRGTINLESLQRVDR